MYVHLRALTKSIKVGDNNLIMNEQEDTNGNFSSGNSEQKENVL